VQLKEEDLFATLLGTRSPLSCCCVDFVGLVVVVYDLNISDLLAFPNRLLLMLM
jgi:hypothetical protein